MKREIFLSIYIVFHVTCFFVGVRPTSTLPDRVRPTDIPQRFDTPEPTSSIGLDDINPNRPGISSRPKFPPRTLPTRPRVQTNSDRNGNEDLISLIPIDRPSNGPSKDDNEIVDNADEKDDPRVLTGGPFIPNFGGGGRPGRPVKIDKNTGRGSATLQKVIARYLLSQIINYS